MSCQHRRALHEDSIILTLGGKLLVTDRVVVRVNAVVSPSEDNEHHVVHDSLNIYDLRVRVEELVADGNDEVRVRVLSTACAETREEVGT